MNREEQVRGFAVRNRGALFQRNEDVGIPRHHHLDPRLIVEQLRDAQRHVEDQFCFLIAVPVRAGIVAAVAGVDDNPRHPQAELTRDRESPFELAAGTAGAARAGGTTTRDGRSFGSGERDGPGWHCRLVGRRQPGAAL